MTAVMGDLAIVGTTASGKSALAMKIALELGDYEIVSVDSMQVYRGMDIGTAKPEARERSAVRHHMIDLVDPSETFDLAAFVTAARRAADDIHARGKRAIYVGGTGLYFQCVVDGFELPGQFSEVRSELEGEVDVIGLHRRLSLLDPIAASRMEPTNRRRIVRALEVTLGSGRPFSSFGPGMNEFPQTSVDLIGIWTSRVSNAERIAQRVDAMFDHGWVEEVAELCADGGLSRTATQALGYPQILEYLDGSKSLAEVKEEIGARTRAFARRQRMWFRRDPRIRWYATESEPDLLTSPILRDCFERARGGDAK